MTKKKTEKITPVVADLNYEASITAKARDYAPLMQAAFPTQTSLLVAIDNASRFLQTAYDALDGNVTAEYFCKHSPLSGYPDQLLMLMLLFVDSGVFYPVDPNITVFSMDNANSWKYNGHTTNPEQA